MTIENNTQTSAIVYYGERTAKLNFSNSSVKNNTADASVAIRAYGQTTIVSISNVIFESNTATVDRGTITIMDEAKVVVQDCSFTYNSSPIASVFL